MATLLNCIECGGIVSSQARQCPRCKTPSPLGVKCIVCCKVLKQSEAIKIKKEYGGAENRVSVNFFHPICHKQVSQVRIGKSRTVCPLCKCSVEFDTTSYATCSNCGHSFPTKLKDPSFASCCYCGLRLNKSLEVKIKEDSRPFLDGWITEGVYAHHVCYTPERQAEERKQQRKEQLEIKNLLKERERELRNYKAAKKRNTLILAIFIGLGIGIGTGILGIISHYIFGFAPSWQIAGFLGFSGVFILTLVGVWIFSLFE